MPGNSSTKAQHQQQWIRNHPLEGDGLIINFYKFLYKRNTKTMKACKDVMIPDTVVFEHNFPRDWYTSDFKSKELSKKQGKELDASSIHKGFSKTPDPAVGIVASYMSSYEEEDANGVASTITEVEFFNEETLKEFVGRKQKREGILQKFLIPKGHRNSVIQAIWSPQVCLVQRRTNCGSIRDKLQCDRDPYVCAVTYEGPSHYSEEGTCAGHTTEEVKEICKNIVKHFQSIEHKTITRMVLYFKVDERDQVWLLFCGSLRIADGGQPSGMPLELAPKWSIPNGNQGDSSSPKRDRDDDALLEADQRFYAITHDSMFYSTYVKPAEGENDKGDEKNETQTSSPTKKNQRKDDKKREETKNVEEEEEEDEEWHQLPGIQDQYRELCLDRDLVLSAFDDIFYEAYGHFLRHEPGPFNFEVDRKVSQALGPDVLQELMQAVKIEHAIPSDDAGPSIDDEELCFTIISQQHQGPVTKLGEAVAKWIRNHYAKREQELREEAAAVPPSSKQPGEEDEATNNENRENETEAVEDEVEL